MILIARKLWHRLILSGWWSSLPADEIGTAFPYLADYVDKGADVAVMQLHPLQLLGHLDRYGFDAGHRGGNAQVLLCIPGRMKDEPSF